MEFQTSGYPLPSTFSVEQPNKYLSTFSSSDLKSTFFHSIYSYSIKQIHFKIIQLISLQHLCLTLLFLEHAGLLCTLTS
jgi:hypothetical protein